MATAKKKPASISTSTTVAPTKALAVKAVKTKAVSVVQPASKDIAEPKAVAKVKKTKSMQDTTAIIGQIVNGSTPVNTAIKQQVLGIHMGDEATYNIVHDALNDFIAAPINRANHVQGLLNGINFKSHSYEVLPENFNSTTVDNILTHLQSVYEDSIIVPSTMSHDDKLETFFVAVYRDVFVAGQAKPDRYLQAFVCGSKYIKFINVILPQQMNFHPHQQFFTDLMPPKAFTVIQYDGAGTHISPVDSKDCHAFSEFYPFIPEGVDHMIDEFYASKATNLILTGIAGSGKSTLIRRLFARRESSTFIMVDNSAVYSDPKAFAELVNLVRSKCEENKNGVVTLILEEADYAIQSKDQDAAGTLGRLLSLSSGVVKYNLKIVITSNLSTVDRIDVNLRRSGRTFRVIPFRPLTMPEANGARESIGLKSVSDFKTKELTLAIVLNYKAGDEVDLQHTQRRRVGFTG